MAAKKTEMQVVKPIVVREDGKLVTKGVGETVKLSKENIEIFSDRICPVGKAPKSTPSQAQLTAKIAELEAVIKEQSEQIEGLTAPKSEKDKK